MTLGYLEVKLKMKMIELWGEDFAENTLKYWKRYLDDCFLIWNHNLNQLDQFYNLLNSLNPNIKFTMETSDAEIAFLDIKVIKTNDCISTDIFYKPTDTHQYLHFHSCHPRHTKRAIPYNLARRICVIVSDPQVRHERLHELNSFLTKQKYPKKLILNGIDKALQFDRSQLLTEQQNLKANNDNQYLIPFVMTNNPKNPNISPTIHSLNSMLKEDERTKDIFQNSKFIISKRQPKSLKRILCSSKLTTNKIFSVKKCENPRCGTCSYLREGSMYNFNGKIFTIRHDMSCSTQNVIYVITCHGCNQYYIGETKNTIRCRTRIHKQQINNPNYRQISLSEHLDVCGRKSFSIFPFYKMFSDCDVERKNKERYFIESFDPSLNST